MGSVPGKFDTIVYLNSETKIKGFGSNSERFNVNTSRFEMETEPGPGSYLSDPLIN
jgi:hypothetical protein